MWGVSLLVGFVLAIVAIIRLRYLPNQRPDKVAGLLFLAAATFVGGTFVWFFQEANTGAETEVTAPVSSAPLPSESPELPSPIEPTATLRGPSVVVSRVIDGDTIEVGHNSYGEVVDVRLIGVDTPESVSPGDPVECFAREAARFTRNALNGQIVTLEFDIEEFDRYGRRLAYVWVNGTLFNEVLVRRGYATVATYPPNVAYVDRFRRAQRVARQTGAGLWGGCPEEAEQPPQPEPQGDCDPAYPDVCIPPPPPDLDCDDVSYSAFRVVEYPDPHGFDGDGDGVGCE